MSYFAAVLARNGRRWSASEIDSLFDCESVEDVAELVRDVEGDVRLLVVEQDDEYAVLARIDGDDDVRVFLSDGHAADGYPIAALFAEELTEIGDMDDDTDSDADTDVDAVTVVVHESAPFGDASVAEDLGTSARELLDLCTREGTLPIDVIVDVCERAGCAEVFEAVRA